MKTPEDMVQNTCKDAAAEPWELYLYVIKGTPSAAAAQQNLEYICQEYLPEGSQIVLVDILDQPEQAQVEHVLAVPMAVRKSPLPAKRVVGDLSNMEKTLRGFGIS